MFDESHKTTHHVLVPVVSGVVIKKDGKYLLVQEKQPKAYGLWNFPAGQVDEGESIEMAAVREAKEEVGYDVEIIRKLGVYQANIKTPPKHIFEVKIVGGEFKIPDDELLDAKWFSFDEIFQLDKEGKLRSADWMIGATQMLENTINPN